ncbi:Aminopeptidase Y (Arg, Lys, Leu preference) [Pseudoalteromonas luteoviolacea B = ATCC 29581]|nr:Aminopeptidase Y (Arg, Lys, Leu preference) [Pseudoalteromonas luteoviolacea B = ATCC 29581]
MRIVKPLFLTLAIGFTSHDAVAAPAGWQAMLDLAHQFPNRVGGSETEAAAAKWLTQQYQALGYSVTTQPFEYRVKLNTFKSQNLIVDIPGERDDIVIVGAHFDAVPSNQGSTGFTDNASGAATLLGLAELLKSQKPHFSVRLISFGAEEVGLQGAKYYVNASKTALKNVIGMINLDTVIGGDHLYIHSAHTKPYDCSRFDLDASRYSHKPTLRDALIKQSNTSFLPAKYTLHPETKDYPKGETGSWSDHAPFACAGLPIAYIEATNFMIHGEDGYDGYSQTVSPALWTCFDQTTLGACDRDDESQWGKIWHTRFDQQNYIIKALEKQVTDQFSSNVLLIRDFLISSDIKD